MSQTTDIRSVREPSIEHLHALLGFGLPSTEPRAGVHIALAEWPRFLALVMDERLSGLAVAAWQAGWLSVPDSAVEELLESHSQAMQWVLLLERALLDLRREFESAEVPMVVLKGPTLARVAFPDPSWRSFADLDLLVPTPRWRDALELLASSGFVRRLPEPRGGFDERFGKAAAHVGDQGMEVDLHRTLVLGPFGLWIDLDELWRHTTTFSIASEEFRRLDDTAILANVCIHASLGMRPCRLAPFRDVAQMAWARPPDWELLSSWGQRWRLRAVLHHAFSTVRDTFRISLPDAAEEFIHLRPARFEQRALEAYTSGRRRRGGTALATLHAIPGPRAKVAYIRSMLTPDRRFLDSKSPGSRRPYLQRWGTALRWMSRS